MPNDPMVAEILDNIRRVFQFVNEHSKRVVRETGLTGPQLWAIKVIAERAPIRVSELAKRMYLHPATVVGIIDRLEVQGLVSRTRSRTDRRVVEIDLTPQGITLVAEAPEVFQGVLLKGLGSLSMDTLQEIAGGLDKLVTILGVQETPPVPIVLVEERTLAKAKGKRRG
ncbi:MarR family winged helix-turn-helix transcriptional regulator [Geobacter argillaceus]|uniref:DNA-binding MarR family transcriptional regulator n=1 Tax=Geobacter argillaceus TaxID=345631 RepID=A0A562VNE7_9BACT|nr:MarR family winged helix-turn-helix transcriptional regulator [Geobacter argillaceus]TWJ19408.1 DNA-binding MarR family transcriptional regulator [Geobacter argillaceus]